MLSRGRAQLPAVRQTSVNSADFVEPAGASPECSSRVSKDAEVP